MTFVERMRRLIFSLANTQLGMQLSRLYVGLIDMPISRLTRGAFVPSANGNIMPMIYLTTIGAKSQTLRSLPLLSIPDGLKLILVGSNWGKAQNPSWVYNLRANPQAQVRRGQTTQTFMARELHGAERAAYWQKAIAFYPPYVSYEQRAGRQLPVFLLEP